ncbi:NADH-quinone oxidoreductase subunit C [Streptomyces sp. RFCAC02]|uniref:NADH-quinone oxidoreductase subunit C n=1 Tax=Streptomyces sp. RFCAC02 TaxID=2499143 RepID=UPI001021E5E4
MTGHGGLPGGAAELFGPGAEASEAYGVLTVDVPPAAWPDALRTARDRLGCTFFDWLSAVDEPDGFRVCAHVVALPGEGRPMLRLLLRTAVAHEDPSLPSATDVYAGAAWHERETREMFGIDFPGHPGPAPLLLPDGFEGHPLRKDFVLAARVAKAWPGAKEPGESEHGAPRRRQALPPGVPDPNEWGPRKGQLPARSGDAAARPARRARPAADAAPEETAARPARRMRSASGGSASQRPAGEGASEETAARPARRMRSASGGSASQRPSGDDPASDRPARRGRAGDTPWAQPRDEDGGSPDTPDAPGDSGTPEDGER